MIDTCVLDDTAVVVIVKSADVLPSGTVTVVGGEATLASPLVNITVAPPAGATPFNVTLFLVVEWPPVTLAGDSFRDDSTGAFTVRLAVFVTPS